jgi:type I restriction enzyme, R subunit
MTIHRQLQAMPPLLTERLRECQIDAVTKLEASLAADRPRALIQMATGAGKTYTACVFSHRLLEHAKFRRVLFLADRANLVRQTRHEFEDFRPAGTGRSFTELYADLLPSSIMYSGWGRRVSTRTPRSSSRRSSGSTHC